MKEIKLVVGLGNAEDYPSYVHEGADEVFFGYVPYRYMKEFGRFNPVNRREVVFYNVQLGGESELQILKMMQSKIPAELTVTVNAPVYTPRERTAIVEIVKELKNLGIKDYIVADEELISFLSSEEVNIHISGEYGELNTLTVKHLANYGPKRIIFPRQTTIAEMRSIINNCRDDIPEFEAFILNEKCHFTGAYCSTRHCDELCHMCKVPYKCEGNRIDSIEDKDYEGLGASGCGLCFLWDLREAGITHIKLVSRGNGSFDTIEDIRAVRKALDILEDSLSKEDYIVRMKEELFLQGCSGNCYYR